MATYLLVQDAPILVAFDVTLSEAHEETAEVTDHPVEEGSNVVDHIRPMPFTLGLEVFVTNTPINEIIFGPIPHIGKIESVELKIPEYEPPIEATPGSLFRLAEAGIGAIGDLITGGPAPFKAQLLFFQDVFDRVLEIQTVLSELKDRGALITCVTSTRFYTDMAITRISMPRTEAGGASFQIDFRQVRLVQTATVQAPKPIEQRGEASKKKGAQATKPVKAKDAVTAKSAALKLLEAAGVDF